MIKHFFGVSLVSINWRAPVRLVVFEDKAELGVKSYFGKKVLARSVFPRSRKEFFYIWLIYSGAVPRRSDFRKLP